MLVSFALGDANFSRHLMQNPNASQWKIGGSGSSGDGHVYFMYISCIFHVVYASFSALATQELADTKADFSGIWALLFPYLSFPYFLLSSLLPFFPQICHVSSPLLFSFLLSPIACPPINNF